jgi:hypothetical protein
LRTGEYHFKEDSMKRSLIFGLIAVLSAGILFVGCSQATDSTETTVEIPGTGVVIDHTASTADGLKTDLMNTSHPDWQVIAFDISGDGVTGFAGSTTIPQGKTVVLVNSASKKRIDVGEGGLIIEGKLIVSNTTGVSAVTEGNKKIFIGGAGSVEVQKGGELRTDKRASVSNYVVNSANVDSVLTSRVSFSGGSDLTISDEALSITEIGALLGHINLGTRAVGVPTGPSNLILEAVQNVKPSDISTIAGITENRTLKIKAGVAENALTLTIPAGALVTAVEPVTTVTSLEVSGDFTVPASSFEVLTTITVNSGAILDAATNTLPKLISLTASGELKAPQATGDTTAGVVIKVEKGGNVALGTITKVNEGSKVSAGGSIDAVLPATGLNIEPGSKVNGVEMTTEGGYEVISTIPATLEAGKTYELKKGESDTAIAAAGTLSAGATLLIPSAVKVEVAGGAAFAVAGTVKVAGKFDLKGTLANSGTIEVADGGEFNMKDVSGETAGTNTGTITIKAGGKIVGAHGKDLTGSGLTIIEAGGKGYMGAEGTDLFIGGAQDTALFNLVRGTVSFNTTTNIMDGDAALNGVYYCGTDSQVLTLKRGSTFTIASTGQLKPTGHTAVVSDASYGTDAARIVIVSGGKIMEVNNPQNPINFYTSGGAQVTQTLTTAGTYVWTAISSSVSGWKAQ